MPNLSLQELKDFSSNNPTSMVTLLVPPDTNLDKLRTKMNCEVATASNIKDRRNRHAVLDALTRVSVYLNTIKQIPVSGYAIYSAQYL
jgi:peptide chain release factor subunit 1